MSSNFSLSEFQSPDRNCQQYAIEIKVSHPEISLFSSHLNPDRTHLLIHGYCNKDKYFQLVPLEIIKFIILYFNHIIYFNLRKDNSLRGPSKVDRLRDSLCFRSMFTAIKPENLSKPNI